MSSQILDSIKKNMYVLYIHIRIHIYVYTLYERRNTGLFHTGHFNSSYFHKPNYNSLLSSYGCGIYLNSCFPLHGANVGPLDYLSEVN